MHATPRVLVVDDDAKAADAVCTALVAADVDARPALVADACERAHDAWHPRVAVLDVEPAGDGLALVRRLRSESPWLSVLLHTARVSVASAVAAMREGVQDVLVKPAPAERIVAAVGAALDAPDYAQEFGGPAPATSPFITPAFGDAGLVALSEEMQTVVELVQRVATSDVTVLLQGEHGTGKEVIANAIHARSARADRPFVKVNCAAIPADLIEAELFGHRRGAFTGASGDKMGLLEQAAGGTLLLDEIGEMPPALQTKLLRVLQDHEFRPVGSDRTIRVDFRLISATNRDLDNARRAGEFRDDLFFRLNTIQITLPPLRRRPEDILPLAEWFLAKSRVRHDRDVTAIGPDVRRLLLRHAWPGNVRELEHAIEHGVLVARGDTITLADLPVTARGSAHRRDRFRLPFGITLAELERAAILQTLQWTGGNRREAARILGVHRQTLYSKLRRHNVALSAV